MRNIGRFSIFQWVLEQKASRKNWGKSGAWNPGGQWWKQTHFAWGISNLELRKKKLKKAKTVQKPLMDHRKYILFWWVFPITKKNTLEMFVSHCNLCRVPTKKASLLNGKGSVSKVNTWESMPLASKTFRKIYLPTMMINNCWIWGNFYGSKGRRKHVHLANFYFMR